MDKSKFEDNNLALFDIQSKLSAYGPVNSDLKSQLTELKELTKELASNTPTVDWKVLRKGRPVDSASSHSKWR